MEGDTDNDRCDSCDREFPDGALEYGNLGARCFDCLRREYPDHLFDPADDSWSVRGKDVRKVRDATGPGVTVIHVPSGIAAHCSRHPTVRGNERTARKVLDQVIGDVRTVERNERYGTIIE